ncbi:MAG TPA: 3'-5' exonuclease [Acidimicrobiales bacterium]|nr:3'-5' exonuclease [Acidimicrobiales bacterium]
MTTSRAAGRGYAVIDLETTGLSPETDAVTEIAVVLLRDGSRSVFSRLVHPGRAIPADIVQMTGITDRMVADAPPLQDILPEVLALLDGRVVVGHNVGFDLSFLGAVEAVEAIDTADMARRILGDAVPDHCLGTVARHLSVGARTTHRALGDALITSLVFDRLCALDAAS